MRTLVAIPFALVAISAGAVAHVRAADAEEAAGMFAKRVQTSLQAYQDQSSRIAEEKIPLLRQVSQLEDENIALRAKVLGAQKVTADNNVAFDALKVRLDSLKSDSDFSQRYLREYLDGFESRINVAEDQRLKDQLSQIRLAIEKSDQDPGRRYEKQLAAVELGLTRAETLVGGYSFDGAAIARDGVVKKGTIHVFGPSAIFSDTKNGGNTSSIVERHSGTLEPGLAALAPDHAKNIANFFQTKSGPVPLDASLGNAIAVESNKINVAEHVRNGGPVGLAIIALGLVALVLTVVKVFDLSRFRSISTDQLQEVIRAARARNETAALALVRKISGPVGEMLEVGVTNLGINLTLLEDMMLSVMLRRRPEAERFLSFLAVTAVASPLMGLLGTVAGMIRTFSLMTVFGASDPRAVSSGISEALVTTEFGLLVAIPAVAVHGVISRMIKSRLGDMERVAFEFVKTVAVEENAPPTVVALKRE